MIIVLVLMAAFAAFLVSTVTGGGAGLVLVPLLRLILPVACIPGALSIGTAASSISRIWVFSVHIRWEVVRRFVPTALPAAAVGAWLLTLFESAYIEFLLGCFLLFNLPALLRRTGASDAGPALPIRRLPLLGAIAGLLSGFTGAVGVIFNRAYYRMGLSKDEIVATRATNEALLHLLKIALYAGFGLLPRSAMIAGGLVAIAAVLASLMSRRVLALLPTQLFQKAGLAAMVASGVAMFCLSGSQIMAIHRAWIVYVAPGDEREVQLYWGGTRRSAIEQEEDGRVVVERSVSVADLPAAVRAALPAIAAQGDILLIEEVAGTPRYFEIYTRQAKSVVKYEVTPDGLPTNRSFPRFMTRETGI